MLNLKSSSALVVGSGAYAGSISGNAATLAKLAAALTLSASNFYSGPTTITAGTLKAGAANALSPFSSVVINGGTLDATASEKVSGLTVGSLGSLNLTVGTLFEQHGRRHFDGTLDSSSGLVAGPRS